MRAVSSATAASSQPIVGAASCSQHCLHVLTKHLCLGQQALQERPQRIRSMELHDSCVPVSSLGPPTCVRLLWLWPIDNLGQEARSLQCYRECVVCSPVSTAKVVSQVCVVSQWQPCGCWQPARLLRRDIEGAAGHQPAPLLPQAALAVLPIFGCIDCGVCWVRR